jgi:hypothetical protein
MARMKKFLLFFFLIISTLILHGQKDTTAISGNFPQKNTNSDAGKINLIIYPVPVRDNNFTIKSDRDISSVRVTNIIGQDIYRIQFKSSQQLVKVPLENTKRGMYIVTVLFSDGLRISKKIMVEESE